MITLIKEIEKKKACPICSDPSEKMLDCGCEFCEECIFQWVATKNFEILYSSHQILSCPNFSCKKQISFDWLQQNFSKRNVLCINEILFRKSMNSSPDIRKCPNSMCSYIGWVDTNQKCSEFLECELCERAWVDPSLMNFQFIYYILVYISNLKENLLSELSVLNVMMTSKPCPGCGIKICKYMGCDSISCSNCKMNFCYNCLNSHTGSNNIEIIYCFYNCIILFIALIEILIFAVVKLFSSFYYLRTITFYILTFIGLNVVVGVLMAIFGGLVNIFLWDVFHKYDNYSNSPPTIAKFICFILSVCCFILYVWLYMNYESFYFYFNFMFIEIAVALVIGGIYLLFKRIKKQYSKIKYN